MESKKLFKTVGNVFFYAILISLLSISFIMLKSAKEGKQPTIMGHKFFTVMTGSMQPSIMVGDLVIDKEISPEKIKVGDVITFKSQNSENITTHRVKKIIKDGGQIEYITQGDANNVQDQNPVKSNLVIGKVVKCIPKVGNVMLWMKSNLVMIVGVIFALTALSFIGSNLRKKLKDIDEEEKQNENKEKVNV